MRALCGAIISAGALLGLGLAAIGAGTRYQTYPFRNSSGEAQWVYFWQMDRSLIVTYVLLIGSLIVGLAIAIAGLAYHHYRRHFEHLRAYGPHSDTGTRATTP
jgi:hypothetical protein